VTPRSTSRATRTAVVLAASALVLAACGDDGGEEEQRPDGPRNRHSDVGSAARASAAWGVQKLAIAMPQRATNRAVRNRCEAVRGLGAVDMSGRNGLGMMESFGHDEALGVATGNVNGK